MYMSLYAFVSYPPSLSLSATLPGMWERTLTIGSAGKTFNCTGWKVGQYSLFVDRRHYLGVLFHMNVLPTRLCKSSFTCVPMLEEQSVLYSLCMICGYCTTSVQCQCVLYKFYTSFVCTVQLLYNVQVLYVLYNLCTSFVCTIQLLYKFCMYCTTSVRAHYIYMYVYHPLYSRLYVHTL